jgi:hypothetical protein
MAMVLAVRQASAQNAGSAYWIARIRPRRHPALLRHKGVFSAFGVNAMGPAKPGNRALQVLGLPRRLCPSVRLPLPWGCCAY